MATSPQRNETASAEPLGPQAYPCNGRDLMPLPGRPFADQIATWDLVGDPFARLVALCDTLAATATLLQINRWQAWDDAADIATVSRACDRRRLLWTPQQADPYGCWLLLREIGRRNLPAKLIVPYDAAIATWGDWATLSGWWIAAPASTCDCRAALCQALDEEWPTLLLIPPAWQEAEAPSVCAWGALAPVPEDAEVVILAASDGLGLARAIANDLTGRGINAAALPCTSIAPLPMAALRACEERLVLVVDRGSTWSGLGGLWQRVHPAPDCTYCGADDDGLVTAERRVASAVELTRIQLGR